MCCFSYFIEEMDKSFSNVRSYLQSQAFFFIHGWFPSIFQFGSAQQQLLFANFF
jgi:hypothetical protein